MAGLFQNSRNMWLEWWILRKQIPKKTGALLGYHKRRVRQKKTFGSLKYDNLNVPWLDFETYLHWLSSPLNRSFEYTLWRLRRTNLKKLESTKNSFLLCQNLILSPFTYIRAQRCDETSKVEAQFMSRTQSKASHYRYQGKNDRQSLDLRKLEKMNYLITRKLQS